MMWENIVPPKSLSSLLPEIENCLTRHTGKNKHIEKT
jgi:hypothetical protein